MKSIDVYVDGSFDVKTNTYGYGCVFLENPVRVLYGYGNDPENAKQRNVTGEMLGAMNAVLCAIASGYEEINIYYDYQGIECWVTRAWKAKNSLTQAYRDSMNKWQDKIRIKFHKVEAHTGVQYNEIADKMAKRGVEGTQIIKPAPINSLPEYPPKEG